MVALGGNVVGVVDAARALGVARQTVARWLQTGVLEGQRRGRRWVISIETLTTLRRKRATVARIIGAVR